MKYKNIEFKKVYIERNVELDIDPYCHECTSHKKDKKGYIRFHRNGFDTLHRWLYWEKHNDKPECIMHLCDNRSCINIKHIKAGTLANNNTDRHIKGRTIMPDNSGENCGTHILKKTEVEVIKKLIDAGEAIKNIAIRFKVSPYTIYDIKNKRTWKSLSEACYE